MYQNDVYEVITAERDYQDQKWGPGRGHEVGAWLTLMEVHLRRAQDFLASADNDLQALEELRKVLALGVAAAEQHGLEYRNEQSFATFPTI